MHFCMRFLWDALLGTMSFVITNMHLYVPTINRGAHQEAFLHLFNNFQSYYNFINFENLFVYSFWILV
jgi:hypothetical protein